MRPKAKISQQRIARDLGVSQALVSLVLNGRKNGINPDSYRKIWDHAVRLGYSPKGMRAEATPDSMGPRQVGLIMRSGLHLANPSNFFTQVQHGLHAALLAAGVSTVLLGPEENLDERLLGRLLQTQSNATGIVILGEVKLPFLRSSDASRRGDFRKLSWFVPVRVGERTAIAGTFGGSFGQPRTHEVCLARRKPKS